MFFDNDQILLDNERGHERMLIYTDELIVTFSYINQTFSLQRNVETALSLLLEVSRFRFSGNMCEMSKY